MAIGTAQNWIRVGIVSTVDPETNTARVTFDDKGDLVTYPCQQIIPWSQENNASFPLDIGEQVVCAFLPNGQQNGFIIGSVSSTMNPAPEEAEAGVYIISFSDETNIRYDRNKHELIAYVNGDVKMEVTKTLDVLVKGTALVESEKDITLKAPSIILDGDVSVTKNVTVAGNINAGGSIIDATGNTNHHSH